MPKLDPVNSPAHYTAGGVECIEAIVSATKGLVGVKGYLAGNAIKYIWRHSLKGKAIEDLEKAQWYLSRLILLYKVEDVEDDLWR